MQHEALNIDAQFRNKLLSEDGITLSLDGWSNCRMQSLYGFVAILSERVTHLLGLQDLSLDSHTAEFLAGMKFHSYLLKSFVSGYNTSLTS